MMQMMPASRQLLNITKAMLDEANAEIERLNMTQLTQQGLLWQLFLMVKELMPATAENTRRQTEWAESFRALEPQAQSAPEHDASEDPEAAKALTDAINETIAEDDDDDHPIRHAARTRKKR